MPLPAERSFLRARRVAVAAAILLLAGCSTQKEEPYRFTRFAMGTVVEYAITGVPEPVARSAVVKAHAELERVSHLLWEEDSTSEISQINASCHGDRPGERCGEVAASLETREFLARALAYGDESRGRFDVTVGAFTRFYDFGAEHPTAPDTNAIKSLAASLGERHLNVDSAGVSGFKSGVRIAVGGVAKGYAVDRAIGVLREAGIEGALINAGGDLYCLGTNEGRPWRIGIRDPDDPGSVIAALEISDAAVATSGDYQQFFEVDGIKYHHLLDPDTGLPARRARSATIVASSTERADALATGLFVAGRKGLDWIETAPKTEGLIMDADGEIYESSGMDSFAADQ